MSKFMDQFRHQVRCGVCLSWVEIEDIDPELGMCLYCIDDLLIEQRADESMENFFIDMANEQNKKEARQRGGGA